MALTERDSTYQARDERVHEGMRRWMASHIDEYIGELGYDPANPDQWVERVLLEAEPDLAAATRFGTIGMGPEAYQKLIDDLNKIGAVNLVRDNAAAERPPRSTLFATLHLERTLDTAITHNALFTASQDPEFAEMNVVLANYIMSAMTIGGVAVDWVLTRSGHELRAMPDAGTDYVDQEDFEFINHRALAMLNQLLRQGVAIHQAPSGTRGKAARKVSDRSPVISVPMVRDETVQTIIKKSPVAVGVPMKVRPGDSKAVVFEPRYLNDHKDVHRLMHDMIEEINLFNDKLVVYGLPKGIELVKNQRVAEQS